MQMGDMCAFHIPCEILIESKKVEKYILFLPEYQICSQMYIRYMNSI